MVLEEYKWQTLKGFSSYYVKALYTSQYLLDLDSLLESIIPESLLSSYSSPAENRKHVVIQTRWTVLAAMRATASANITAAHPVLMPQVSWIFPIKVSKTRNMRELMKPPSMVNNSDDANFPLYISWSERITTNRRKEYNIELPDPAIASVKP